MRIGNSVWLLDLTTFEISEWILAFEDDLVQLNKNENLILYKSKESAYKSQKVKIEEKIKFHENESYKLKELISKCLN